MTDPRKQAVRDGYDAIGERYQDWARDSAPRRRYLDRLLAMLPPGAEVLELGCGAGLPATLALNERTAVTGVDISPAQIARAKANVPKAQFLCADMVSLDLPAERFDAVTAFCAITHVPREEHAGLLVRMAGWLKPGGLLVITMGATDLSDWAESDWLGAPNFFSHYDASTNLSLVREAGFEILEQEIAAQDLKGEEHISFLWVVARKR